MKKHILTGVFGLEDDGGPASDASGVITLLQLLTGERTLDFGISHAIGDLTSLGVYPSEVGLDFLVLAAHVYAADTRISRASESQDSWTREIKLIVPVSDVTVWQGTVPTLVRMLNFLTGDIWQVEFRPRPEPFMSLIPEVETGTSLPPFDKVQLFSGGLDSLIGTIDNLKNNHTPLLISHAGDGSTSRAQQLCYEAIKDEHPLNSVARLRVWMNIPGDLFQGVKGENTTRGRSFLFFALGVFAGTGLKQPFVLETPENGLIALNVPLDVLRLGSLSTHTTHPFYMDSWNQLLRQLNVTGRIENPYWACTKGEMVRDCKNSALLQRLLPVSLSCSSPAKARWKKRKSGNCGYCLPCLIRRASFNHDGSPEDTTDYALKDLSAQKLNPLQSEGQQVRSFQVAIKRLKENPGLAKILIHKAGPLPTEALILTKLSEVYLRGMMEVEAILTQVVTEPPSKL